MCYQKFHICHYCNNPYPCDEDNHSCPTINHDADMEMCLACKGKLETKLTYVDLEQLDLMNIDFEKILMDIKDNE